MKKTVTLIDILVVMILLGLLTAFLAIRPIESIKEVTTQDATEITIENTIDKGEEYVIQY